MTAPHRYFSQGGEDFLLWRALGDQANYFVEVGAFDGLHLSNSYSFELGGWGGLCVEANPRFAELCANQRPNSTVVRAACVAPGAPEVVTFLSEPLGLLSGIRADLTEGMERRYRSRGMNFEGFVPIEVPAMTLDKALRTASAPEQIGFVSIDVEGTELDVLAGFDFERCDCAVFVVEANTSEAGNDLEALFAAVGYSLYRQLGQNSFFSRDDRIGELLATTTVDCLLEDVHHPDGESATHPHQRGGRILIEP